MIPVTVGPDPARYVNIPYGTISGTDRSRSRRGELRGRATVPVEAKLHGGDGVR
jgi:hypothetical protein